jgi:hypothetical protein
MKSTRYFIVAALAVGLATVSSAADNPQPAAVTPAPASQTPVTETPAAQSGAVATPFTPAPTAGIVDVPENQAEIEAIRSGQLKLVQPEGAAPVPAVDPARAERRAAFDAVIAGQDAKVQSLADRLASAKGDEVLAIQKEIEREKLAVSRGLLELQLEFATRDGDQPRIERLQAALAEWDAPAPVGTPVDRPVPSNLGR